MIGQNYRRTSDSNNPPPPFIRGGGITFKKKLDALNVSLAFCFLSKLLGHARKY